MHLNIHSGLPSALLKPSSTLGNDINTAKVRGISTSPLIHPFDGDRAGIIAGSTLSSRSLALCGTCNTSLKAGPALVMIHDDSCTRSCPRS